MEFDRNPIIQNNPVDTLHYIQSIMAALEEFYAAVDLPKRELDELTNCGLYWILKCTESALAFEVERLTQSK